MREPYGRCGSHRLFFVDIERECDELRSEYPAHADGNDAQHVEHTGERVGSGVGGDVGSGVGNGVGGGVVSGVGNGVGGGAIGLARKGVNGGGVG